jgi:large subunit ribosomal protein L22
MSYKQTKEEVIAERKHEVRAKLNGVRISPRKVQIVLDLVRGQSVEKALAILKYTPKAASPLIEKLIKSAVANAEDKNNTNQNWVYVDTDNLYVKTCFVGPGTTMKRFMARARGSGARILKRTSNITVILDEITDEMKEKANRKKSNTKPNKGSAKRNIGDKVKITPVTENTNNTTEEAKSPAGE